MVFINNDIFSEDPLHKMHFDEFCIPTGFELYLGYHPSVKKSNGQYKILLELEQPNRFNEQQTHQSTFLIEDTYDKILTINKDFVENRNKILGKKLYEYCYFPFNSRYIPNVSIEEKNDSVVYVGNVDIFNMFKKAIDNDNITNYTHVGSRGSISGVSYLKKIQLTSQAKISLSHSLMYKSDETDFISKLIPTLSDDDAFDMFIRGDLIRKSETISYNFQHKARTIEAAFCKNVIVQFRDAVNLIEDFFTEGEDFVYYEKGILSDILNNYDNYKQIAYNAYNKAVTKYTTKSFYNDFLLPVWEK
tara:strand:+ start:1305 stop:2216 length:912 start_codon:yes stop_codon:yes gene_type:complete